MEVTPPQVPKHGKFVVLFYAPYCGYCREYKPVFEQLQRYLDMEKCGVKALMVNVETTSPPSWMSAGPITTVPKVVLLHNGSAKVFPSEHRKDLELLAHEACSYSGGIMGGSKPSWKEHVKSTFAKHRGMQFGDVMKLASRTYHS